MPLPLAHGLLGATLAAAVARGRGGGGRGLLLTLFAGAFLANAADLDFALVFALRSGAWHRGFTHSFAFALAVSLSLAALLGRRRIRDAAAYGLAYASHCVLDFATTKAGGGLQLLWPFDAGRFGLRWVGFSELPSRVPAVEIVKMLLLEFAIFAPPLLIVLLLKSRAGNESGG